VNLIYFNSFTLSPQKCKVINRCPKSFLQASLLQVHMLHRSKHKIDNWYGHLTFLPVQNSVSPEEQDLGAIRFCYFQSRCQICLYIYIYLHRLQEIIPNVLPSFVAWQYLLIKQTMRDRERERENPRWQTIFTAPVDFCGLLQFLQASPVISCPAKDNLTIHHQCKNTYRQHRLLCSTCH
jgi:hypothetical protein